MLFDSDDFEFIEVLPVASSLTVHGDQQPIPLKTIHVSAQDWEEIREAYSADLLAEKKHGKVGSVRSVDYRGHKYTVLSVMHAGHGESYCEAWQLIPRSCYSGECFVDAGWHRSKELCRSLGYDRMLVNNKGTQYVLAAKVKFMSGLPTVPPLTLGQAQQYDERASAMGWRAHFYKGVKPEWKMYAGHPVVVYSTPNDPESLKVTLIWKHKGSIIDFRLQPSVLDDLQAPCLQELDAKRNESSDLFQPAVQTAKIEHLQGSLF